MASKISVPHARAEIKRWLPVRFVHRVEQAFCFASVARSQRSLLPGFGSPASSIFRPPVEAVFLLHVFLHGGENARAEFLSLGSSGGVVTEYARILLRALAPLAFGSETVLPTGEAPRSEALKIWLQR
jgi:hypothetical protein